MIMKIIVMMIMVINIMMIMPFVKLTMSSKSGAARSKSASKIDLTGRIARNSCCSLRSAFFVVCHFVLSKLHNDVSNHNRTVITAVAFQRSIALYL